MSSVPASHAGRILLVDDDRRLADSMAEWLRDLGYVTDTAYRLDEGRQRLGREDYALALVDLRLGMDDGMDLIRHVAQHHEQTSTLAITGFATPATAVEAINCGATDLLTKPVIDEELRLAIDRALAGRAIQEENRQLKAQLDRRQGLEHILSHDYRMLKIFDVIDSVADARASILITGENGTGKSMIARAVHARSSRRDGPLVEVACGALPDSLLESELFGHVAGAFTGATMDRTGKFEAADGGTLFLDEIATATSAMQVKLLRVLQNFEFEPLGGTQTKRIDTRVIFATNENLSRAVADNRFRQDLFYRINVVNLEIPALRDRPGDIPLLASHFVREACEETQRDVEGFDREAMQRLQDYGWPGNVRQLENVVERAVLLSQQSTLTVEDLPPEVLGRPIGAGDEHAAGGNAGFVAPAWQQGMSLKEALETPERAIILQSLRANDFNRVATAEALDINRTTLYKKMKRLGLDDPRLQYAESQAKA